MSTFRSVPQKLSVFNTAKRLLREGTRGINGSINNLKPISENRPLTGTERSSDPEKDGYTPSGPTGTPPKDGAKGVEEDDRDRRRDVRTIPRTYSSCHCGKTRRALTPSSVDTLTRRRRRRYGSRRSLISITTRSRYIKISAPSVYPHTKTQRRKGTEVRPWTELGARHYTDTCTVDSLSLAIVRRTRHRAEKSSRPRYGSGRGVAKGELERS